MKRIFIISSLFLFHTAYADNVIYKCTSSTGEITYQNNMGDRNECTKTNFASFPSINFFKQDAPKAKPVNSNNSTVANNSSEKNVSNNNVSEEQRIRDSKRALILTQELSQEKEQLNTVSLMLKNLKDTNSKDNNQISQLEELKNSHVNNITAIERELGNTKNIVKPTELKIEKASLEPNLNNQTMMVTKAVLPNKTLLPTSLPEAQTVPVSTKKDAIKPVLTNNKPSLTSVKPVETKNIEDKNKSPIDKRKSNSLGNNTSYVSGLSPMSKIKN